jgi:hypothetical protein
LKRELQCAVQMSAEKVFFIGAGMQRANRSCRRTTL